MRTPSSLYVIQVVPIVRGFKDTDATYFSGSPFSPGMLIQIPFRSKERMGIVVSSRKAGDMRSEIRGGDFSLRKIRKQTGKQLFSKKFLGVVAGLSEYYAAPPSDILAALIPASVTERGEITPLKRDTHRSEAANNKRSFVQALDNERVQVYVKKIKRALSDGLSTLILVPTTEDARLLAEHIETVLDSPVVEISSRLSKKKQSELWEAASNSKDPVVAVVTLGFVSVPLPNTGLFIIEKSGSGQFVSRRKPFIDGRVVLEIMWGVMGGELISGDVLIPLSELESRALASLDSLKLNTEARLINMAKKEDDLERLQKKEFQVLSDELIESTRSALQCGENVFWFVARRGVFPQTVCGDCGNEHVCQNCGLGLVLHERKSRGEAERFFLCHRCGQKEDALTTCRSCGSWKLVPLGIGIGHVAQRAQELGLNPLIISQDATPTKTQVKKVMASFSEPQDIGHLLIGTDMALPLISEPIPLVGIVSMDSRLTIPSYTAEESALRTLLSVCSKSSGTCLIQTRRPEHRVFKHTNGRALNEFRKEDREMRKTFLYPPFGTLITISFSATKERAETWIHSMIEELKPLLIEGQESVSPLPLRGSKQRGVYEARAVLKIKEPLVNRVNVREYLELLSPSIEVRVNPENLW